MLTWKHHWIGVSIVAVLVALVIAPPALAQDDADNGPSALEKLESHRLNEILQRLGMTELQSAYLETYGRGPEILMARAQQPGVLPADRNSMLDEAIEAFRQQIEQIKPATTIPKKRALYGLQYLLAQALVLRAEPYVLREVYLEAGQADYVEARPFMSEASGIYQFLIQDINDTIEEMSTPGSGVSSADYIVVMPVLERLQLEIGYRAGWAYVYDAMMMEVASDQDQAKKLRLLEDAFFAMEPFTTGDDDYGVQVQAIYLTGLSLCASGRYAEARAQFSQILSREVNVDNLFNAMFQYARALAEEGNFAEALGAKEQFEQRLGEALAGTPATVDVDMRSAALGYFIYDRWAQSVQAPSEKTHRNQLAQLALASFLKTQTDKDVQISYLLRVGERFRGQDQPTELGTLILLAKGYELAYLKFHQAEGDDAEQERIRGAILGFLKEEFMSRGDEIVAAFRTEAQRLITYFEPTDPGPEGIIHKAKQHRIRAQ